MFLPKGIWVPLVAVGLIIAYDQYGPEPAPAPRPIYGPEARPRASGRRVIIESERGAALGKWRLGRGLVKVYDDTLLPLGSVRTLGLDAWRIEPLKGLALEVAPGPDGWLDLGDGVRALRADGSLRVERDGRALATFFVPPSGGPASALLVSGERIEAKREGRVRSVRSSQDDRALFARTRAPIEEAALLPFAIPEPELGPMQRALIALALGLE